MATLLAIIALGCASDTSDLSVGRMAEDAGREPRGGASERQDASTSRDSGAGGRSSFEGDAGGRSSFEGGAGGRSSFEGGADAEPDGGSLTPQERDSGGADADAAPGTCFSPTQNVERAYSCVDDDGCRCESDDDVCVEGDDRRFYALRCEEGFWIGTSNASCATDDTRCFSPTENLELATSGSLKGCACDAGDDALEVCAIGDGIRLPMWCQDGFWVAEQSDLGCGLAWDLCALTEPPDAGTDAGR